MLIISSFFSASTVAAEIACPICKVVYPANDIEMHASACNVRYVVVLLLNVTCLFGGDIMK